MTASFPARRRGRPPGAKNGPKIKAGDEFSLRPVELSGVPTLPDDVHATLAARGGRPLSDEQEARAAAAIEAAKREILRRQGLANPEFTHPSAARFRSELPPPPTARRLGAPAANTPSPKEHPMDARQIAAVMASPEKVHEIIAELEAEARRLRDELRDSERVLRTLRKLLPRDAADARGAPARKKFAAETRDQAAALIAKKPALSMKAIALACGAADGRRLAMALRAAGLAECRDGLWYPAAAAKNAAG